jgi:hypothetical protein
MDGLIFTFTCAAMIGIAGLIFDALARREARQRNGKSK